MEFPNQILQRLEASGVVAAFSVQKASEAIQIAQALLSGGIDAIELTLRTPAAMEALRAIHSEVPEILAGVGTVLTPETAWEVKESGADFGVSPGLNSRVVKAAQKVGLPFVPGICTPSDLEAAIALGCRFVKFFPAEPAGGVVYLRSIALPYRHLGIRYFPLGGLNAGNMLYYLREDNIPVVGGSWIVKKDFILKKDWKGLAACAAEVRRMIDDEEK